MQTQKSGRLTYRGSALGDWEPPLKVAGSTSQGAEVERGLTRGDSGNAVAKGGDDAEQENGAWVRNQGRSCLAFMHRRVRAGLGSRAALTHLIPLAPLTSAFDEDGIRTHARMRTCAGHK